MEEQTLRARFEATAKGFMSEISNMERRLEDIDRTSGRAADSLGAKLSRGFQKAEKAGTKLQNIGGSLTKKVTTPALGAATAVGGITAALGWKRLVGLDTAKAKLEGLGYTSKEVGSITDQVTEAIDGGMTTMAEGVDIAAGALAAGVEEGDELQRYIKLVGDAAVGANRPVGEMAQIFNRVQGQGKLMTQELNMVEEGMPGFSAAMAKHLNVGQEEFRKMVTDGQVSSEEFLKVMDSFAGGMAESYADSWQGMVQNTKSYIGILGESLLSGVFEESKASLSDFIELLQSEEAKKWAEETGEKLGHFVSLLIERVKALVQWFNNLNNWQKKLIGGMGALAVGIGPALLAIGTLIKFFSKIGASAVAFFGVITKVGGVVAFLGKKLAFLSKFLSLLITPAGLITAAIIALGAAFIIAYHKSETFRNFVDGIVDKIKIGIDWVRQFSEAIIKLFQGDTAGGENILNKLFPPHVVEGIKQTVETIKSVIETVFNAVLEFISFIGSKIGEFWAHYGQDIINAFKRIGSVVGDVFNEVSGFIQEIIAKIVDFWQENGPMIMEAIQNIQEALKAFWDFIQPMLSVLGSGLLEGLKIVFTTLLNLVKNVLSFIGNNFKTTWEFIKNNTMTVWNMIKGIISGLLDIIMGIIKTFSALFTGNWSELWEGIKQIVSGLLQVIWSIIKGVFQQIWNFTKFIFQQIWNFIKLVWNTIKDIIVGAVKLIWNRIKTYFELVWTFVQNIFNRVKEFIVNVWNYIKSRVVSFARAIWTGIKSAFSSLWNTIKSIFTTVKDWLIDTWDYIKVRIVALARVIWRRVKSAFSSLWDTIKSIFTTVKDWLIKTWNFIKDKVVGTVKALWSGVKSIFSSLWNGIKSIITTLRKWLIDAWNFIKNKVTSTVQGLWTGVKSTFDKLWQGTKRIFNTVKNWLIDTWNNIKDTVVNKVQDLWDRVNDIFGNMRKGLDKIIGKIKDIFNDMLGGVEKGVNGLIKGINKIGEKLSLPEIPEIKMPKFSTGTSSTHQQNLVTNGKLNRDTNAIVGDKGPGNGPGGFRQEMIEEPNGKRYLTPKTDTLMRLKKGSKIYNGQQTYDYLNTPKFNWGTDALNWVGEKAQYVGKKVKDGTKALMDKVGDIWEYASNPGKLFDLIMDTFNLDGFKDMGGGLIGDIARGAWKKIKKGVIDFFKGGLEDMQGGDGSSFTKFNKTTPYSPNKPVPGYPTAFNGGRHYGIDYDTPVGTTLEATNSGKVSKINDRGGGLIAKLLSGGYTQFFMHLSKVLKTGQVQTGDAFAKTGNSGEWTTGPHLHYQVEKGDSSFVTNKNTVDPEKYLAGNGGGNVKGAKAARKLIKRAQNALGGKYKDSYITKQMMDLAKRESNYDPQAVNNWDVNAAQGTPSKGLFQIIKPTFDAFAKKGMRNYGNPLHQAVSVMRYIDSKYTPHYGFKGAFKRAAARAYAGGGIVNAPELAWVAEGGFSESIISHDPSRRMRSKVIHDRTGDMLGFNEEPDLLRDIIKLLSEANVLQLRNNKDTKAIANKDWSFNLNGKTLFRENNRQGNLDSSTRLMKD